MVVYSFYIFDRHTECIYSRLWARPTSRPSSLTVNPARPTSTSSTSSNPPQLAPPITVAPITPLPTTNSTAQANPPPAPIINQHLDPARARPARLSASDDAKLIFGTIFSLRNMVRKLGGQDDSFISYRTGGYKLHYYETVSSVKFVMLTDTGMANMRNVLHQIYVNLYVEFVVKNPLSPVEHPGGEGVANELFELALDQFVKGVL